MFDVLTPTLMPATHTNSYALGGRDVILIEPSTPYADEQKAWIDWARGLESQGRELVAIVPTHHHPDHVGGIEVLSRELGVPLWAHAETAARVPGVTFSRMLDEGDEIVLDGPRPESWRVMFTPGHAPGHVTLFEPHTKTLVVGDMVASVGTILIPPDDGDMQRYLVELERLSALDASLALPAHGDPIDAPSDLFRRYVVHRLMRENKVLAAVKEAPGDLSSLVPIAYQDTPAHLWPIARLSLEAHLIKLVREGRVMLRGDRYEAAA